jgi:deoxyribose-phosphate aldolase
MTPILGVQMQKFRNLAQYIEHSCFRAEATPTEIQKLCDEAIEYKFRAVSINSGFVAQCSRVLKKFNIAVVSTVGFPLGACTSDVKIYEAKRIMDDGGNEIEVVMAIGLLRNGSYTVVERELDAVTRAANGAPVNVIIETSLLTKEELVLACKLAVSAGATGINTSTGFCGGNPSSDQIKLIRNVVGTKLAVKASGGIRTFNDAETLLQAGASSLGTSAGPRIITFHEFGPGGEKDTHS